MNCLLPLALTVVACTSADREKTAENSPRLEVTDGGANELIRGIGSRDGVAGPKMSFAGPKLIDDVTVITHLDMKQVSPALAESEETYVPEPPPATVLAEYARRATSTAIVRERERESRPDAEYGISTSIKLTTIDRIHGAVPDSYVIPGRTLNGREVTYSHVFNIAAGIDYLVFFATRENGSIRPMKMFPGLEEGFLIGETLVDRGTAVALIRDAMEGL